MDFQRIIIFVNKILSYLINVVIVCSVLALIIGFIYSLYVFIKS